VPPNQKSAVADLSSYDDNGVWRITDLNTGKFLLAYNDKNHWNLNLRDEFFQKVFNFITKNRHSTCGIRVIMDITEQNKKISIEDGGNKLKVDLDKKNYQDSDHIDDDKLKYINQFYLIHFINF
jgi:hypothetical protein